MVENAFETGIPRPEAVQIVPASVVDDLVARHEAELGALRVELEVALKEADEVERRLAESPVASQYSNGFEAEILELMTRIGSYIARDWSVEQHPPVGDEWHPARNGSPGPPTSAPYEFPGGGLGPPPMVRHPEFETPVRDTVHSETVVLPIVRPRLEADESEPGRPRTVVVQRGRHLKAGVSEQSLLADRPASVTDNDADSLAVLRTHFDAPAPAEEKASSGEQSAVDARLGWMAKVPSRLLIQLGALVILVGLFVLKLG